MIWEAWGSVTKLMTTCSTYAHKRHRNAQEIQLVDTDERSKYKQISSREGKRKERSAASEENVRQILRLGRSEKTAKR